MSLGGSFSVIGSQVATQASVPHQVRATEAQPAYQRLTVHPDVGHGPRDGFIDIVDECRWEHRLSRCRRHLERQAPEEPRKVPGRHTELDTARGYLWKHYRRPTG